MDRSVPFRRAVVAAAVTAALFAAWTLLPGDGTRLAGTVVDAATVLASALAAVAAAWACRRAVNGARPAWGLLAAGFALLAVGELLWAILSALGGGVPFPSVVDAAYLLATPFLLAGLLHLPGAPTRAAVRLRLLLDGAVVAGSLFLVSWTVVLRPLSLGSDDRLLELVVALAYPVSDVALVAVAVTTLARTDRSTRCAGWLLTGGLVGTLLSDAAFAGLALSGGYSAGSLVDAGWFASYLAFALAALAPPARRDSATVDDASRATVMLPYPPFVVAVVVTVSVAARTGGIDAVQAGTTGLLLAVLAMRQLVTTLDNHSLAERLYEALAELSEREEHFRSLVQGSSDVISICEADGTVRFLSPSVERIFGHRTEEIVGRTATQLVHPDDLTRVMREVAQLVQQGDPSPVTFECRFRHRNGGWRHVESVFSNQLANPAVRGLVFNTRDVSDRRQLEQQLTHQAFHDPLTGLANRALFRDRLHHALALRQRTRQPLAVLLVDLDDFKEVNDSLGHGTGDRLLATVADRLQECVRSGDTVARLGGDEFAVLLEDIEGVHVARSIAERFIDELRTPFLLDRREVVVGASIGLAEADGTDDADELLRNADLAMYRAKRLGKGRCEFFEPHLHEAVVARVETESDLRRAVAAGELQVLYQPVVDLGTGVVVGVEALLRWEHPRRGTIMPQEFIAIAEDSGLIVPIGRWVLEQALHQAVVWERETGRSLHVAVNLSARQLGAPRLIENVARALRTSGVPPRRLVLEITESMFVDDADRTVAKLHLLRELGVRLAIDDFGTGYSSLNYLRRLPVDVLKIDRSFVAGLGRERELNALTRAIVGLAGELGLQTVAEGIEEPGQLEELIASGCELGQGFLFARPLTEAGVLRLLRAGGVVPLPAVDVTHAAFARLTGPRGRLA